jgi:hypothetical protein
MAQPRRVVTSIFSKKQFIKFPVFSKLKNLRMKVQGISARLTKWNFKGQTARSQTVWCSHQIAWKLAEWFLISKLMQMFSLCLIMYHDMKTPGGVSVGQYLQAFLSFTLHKRKWPASCPVRFTSGERSADTLTARYLRASLTVTNTRVSGHPADVRRGKGCDNA